MTWHMGMVVGLLLGAVARSLIVALIDRREQRNDDDEPHIPHEWGGEE